jgi:putative transposase
MANSYIQNFMHCVFSTKNRRPLIRTDLQHPLWAYMGGIAKQNGFKAIEIGGTEDHVHALLSLPSDLAIAKALQLIKGGSSKWFRETHSPEFGWQSGYGAFSVSASLESKTVAYIRNQKEHHKKRDFQGEYIRLLRLHGVDFDMKYVFD